MKIRQNIKDGIEIVGMFLSEITMPNILRIMKVSGLDFVIVDCEHGCFDFSHVSALAAVGNGISFPVLVRTPTVDRDYIQKYLDAGIDGILVPMVETKKQAELLVQYGKYTPLGKRGITTMRPHSNYTPGDLKDYLIEANKRTLLFIQIETQEGVENINEIINTPGIDGVFVGPNDLSSDLGSPGNFSTPEMELCIKKIIETTTNAGIPCGIITSKADYIKACRKKGMTMFSCNSEIGILKDGIRNMLHELNS